MPGDTGVRWYRHGGERLPGTFMISFPSIFASWLVVYGIGHPVRWALLIPGAVLAMAFAAVAVLPMRAGIGVTSEHILIRTATGRTRVIPWAQVTGFKDSYTPRGGGTIYVLTSGGERWHTSGYAPAGSSRWEGWHLLRVLEDERIARTPGAARVLPPRPPPPSPGVNRAPWVWAGVGVITLIILGSLPLYSAVTEFGPAIRAARGEGTVGYFIPQREATGKGATWYGEFRLPDGTVTLRNVSIEDLPVSAMQAGVPVAARDTGYAEATFLPGTPAVFPRDDPGAWRFPASLAVMGAWFYGWALVLLIRAADRRLRPSRRGHIRGLTGATSPAASPDAPAPATRMADAAAALAGQRGWSFTPIGRQDPRQHRSTLRTGLQLGRLNGTLDGRPVTVAFWERVTSVLIALPAGTVPKVLIGIDRNSGQFAYRENAALGQMLMTPSTREALNRAGFTAVTFNQNQLAGAFPGVLTADEIIEALRGLEMLLAAMPGDVLRAHGVRTSDSAKDGDHS